MRFVIALVFLGTVVAIGNSTSANESNYGYSVPRASKQSTQQCTDITQSINCDSNVPFRTIDGTCNNLRNPYWGVQNTPFRRILSPAYADGKSVPRGGVRSTLPNPRVISTTVHSDLVVGDRQVTHMVPQVGQFLDHDLTLSFFPDKDCCGADRNDRECFSIPIPSNDRFYGPKNQTCMPLARSMPYCRPGPNGNREQMNTNTAYIDLSQVYGSNAERARQLREFKGGRLFANNQFRGFLPSIDQMRQKGASNTFSEGGYFASGDIRTNEQPGLSTMHILFFREHNRLAAEIQNIRPRWDDEKIFQFSKGILTAIWQKIVFGNFLPVVLGDQAMRDNNLAVLPTKFSRYNPQKDASIIQGFSTAAYRFGHSMINGLINLMRDNNVVDQYRVRDGFSNSAVLQRNNGDGFNLLLNGLTQQNAQVMDRFVTEDLTNFLERMPNRDFGSDLVTRNIQRGRDHGIPPYDSYRRHCGMQALGSWNDRPREISEENWKRLRSVYSQPKDIDLFTGGLSETPWSGGGLTGPVFNCIKVIQFDVSKFGDRFFYTHENQAGSFSERQLQMINRVNLGDLICLNSNIQRTAENVFRPSGNSNPVLACDSNRRTYLRMDEFFR